MPGIEDPEARFLNRIGYTALFIVSSATVATYMLTGDVPEPLLWATAALGLLVPVAEHLLYRR